LPKVFGFFSLLSAPKFFPPTYLPPLSYIPPTYLTSFCTHSIIKARENLKWEGKRRRAELGAKSGRVEVAAKSGRAKVAAKSGRAKVAARNERAEMVARTTHLKWESKVRGQNRSLKVSSLPSFHFLLLFSCVVLL